MKHAYRPRFLLAVPLVCLFLLLLNVRFVSAQDDSSDSAIRLIQGNALNDAWNSPGDALAVGGADTLHADRIDWAVIYYEDGYFGLSNSWSLEPDDIDAAGSGSVRNFDGVETMQYFSYLPIVAEQPQHDNRIALVVRHGDGEVVTRCVDIDGPSATGLEVLLASGLALNLVVQPPGAAICSLDNEGCEFPMEPCFCACTSSPCFYWSYWQLKDNEWTNSQWGASNSEIVAGSVEGWSWSQGTISDGALQAPPVESFTNVCPPRES